MLRWLLIVVLAIASTGLISWANEYPYWTMLMPEDRGNRLRHYVADLTFGVPVWLVSITCFWICALYRHWLSATVIFLGIMGLVAVPHVTLMRNPDYVEDLDIDMVTMMWFSQNWFMFGAFGMMAFALTMARLSKPAG